MILIIENFLEKIVITKRSVKLLVEFHLTATGRHLIAIWDHTVLPATRHKWTRPAFTPASKPVLDLPTPEGWKAELT